LEIVAGKWRHFRAQLISAGDQIEGSDRRLRLVRIQLPEIRNQQRESSLQQIEGRVAPTEPERHTHTETGRETEREEMVREEGTEGKRERERFTISE
jgi:hypothetical protein